MLGFFVVFVYAGILNRGGDGAVAKPAARALCPARRQWEGQEWCGEVCAPRFAVCVEFAARRPLRGLSARSAPSGGALVLVLVLRLLYLLVC